MASSFGDGILSHGNPFTSKFIARQQQRPRKQFAPHRETRARLNEISSGGKLVFPPDVNLMPFSGTFVNCVSVCLSLAYDVASLLVYTREKPVMRSLWLCSRSLCHTCDNAPSLLFPSRGLCHSDWYDWSFARM